VSGLGRLLRALVVVAIPFLAGVAEALR